MVIEINIRIDLRTGNRFGNVNIDRGDQTLNYSRFLDGEDFIAKSPNQDSPYIDALTEFVSERLNFKFAWLVTKDKEATDNFIIWHQNNKYIEIFYNNTLSKIEHYRMPVNNNNTSKSIPQIVFRGSIL